MNGSDADFMRAALRFAAEGCAQGEVPVGAVLVQAGEIIAGGANAPIGLRDPTAHAEILTLRAGGARRGNYRLNGMTLYVTLEPCVMCAAAMVHARIDRVVFGAWDARAGGAGSVVDVFSLRGLNHRVDVFGGVLAEECKAALDAFFASRRRSV